MTAASDLLASDWPLAFAVDGEGHPHDGCCPCGYIHGTDFEIDIHCWRRSCDAGCAYSGIHVRGAISVGLKRAMAIHIRDHNPWSASTDWTIVIE